MSGNHPRMWKASGSPGGSGSMSLGSRAYSGSGAGPRHAAVGRAMRGGVDGKGLMSHGVRKSVTSKPRKAARKPWTVRFNTFVLYILLAVACSAFLFFFLIEGMPGIHHTPARPHPPPPPEVRGSNASQKVTSSSANNGSTGSISSSSSSGDGASKEKTRQYSTGHTDAGIELLTSGERLEREVEAEEADLAVQLGDTVGRQKRKADATKQQEIPAVGDGGKVREEVKAEPRVERTESGKTRDSGGKQAEQKVAESKPEKESRRVESGREEKVGRGSKAGEKNVEVRKEERREERQEDKKEEKKEERKAVRAEPKKEKVVESTRSHSERRDLEEDVVAKVQKVSPRKETPGNKPHKDSTKGLGELGVEDVQLVVNPRAWLRRGRGGRQQHGKPKGHEQPHGREKKQEQGRGHQQQPKRVQEIEMEKQIKEVVQQEAERGKHKDGGSRKDQGSQQLPDHHRAKQRAKEAGGEKTSEESEERVHNHKHSHQNRSATK